MRRVRCKVTFRHASAAACRLSGELARSYQLTLALPALHARRRENMPRCCCAALPSERATGAPHKSVPAKRLEVKVLSPDCNNRYSSMQASVIGASLRRPGRACVGRPHLAPRIPSHGVLTRRVSLLTRRVSREHIERRPCSGPQGPKVEGERGVQRPRRAHLLRGPDGPASRPAI